MRLRDEVPNAFHGHKHRESSVQVLFLPFLIRIYFPEPTNLTWALSVSNITYYVRISPITLPPV